MKNNIFSIVFLTCIGLFAFSTSSEAHRPIRTKKVVVVKKRPAVKRVVVRQPVRSNLFIVKPAPRARVVKTKVIRRTPFGAKRKVVIRRR